MKPVVVGGIDERKADGRDSRFLGCSGGEQGQLTSCADDASARFGGVVATRFQATSLPACLNGRKGRVQ
jgi:hypothetical protein